MGEEPKTAPTTPSLEVLALRLNSLQAEVEGLMKTIRGGNGDPGLVSKHSRLKEDFDRHMIDGENIIKEVRESINTIKDLLLGEMTGKEGESGLIEIVRRHERILANAERLGWAILTILLGILVTQIYSILVTHSVP